MSLVNRMANTKGVCRAGSFKSYETKASRTLENGSIYQGQ